MTPKEYQEYVKAISPKSPLVKDTVLAFVIGGGICTVGQVILDFFARMGLEKQDAGTAAAITPTGFDWLGLILISFVLPAILAPAINAVCRKLGWVKDGDLTLS